MPGCSNHSSKLSFFAWNINGLSSKPLGDKLRNTECLSMINSFDFIILSETWKRVSVDVEGFKIVTTSTSENQKRWSQLGGLALLYKSKFNDSISVEKESSNFLWFKISKEYTKTARDIYVSGNLRSGRILASLPYSLTLVAR